jgi:hypothetical protein
VVQDVSSKITTTCGICWSASNAAAPVTNPQNPIV